MKYCVTEATEIVGVTLLILVYTDFISKEKGLCMDATKAVAHYYIAFWQVGVQSVVNVRGGKGRYVHSFHTFISRIHFSQQIRIEEHELSSHQYS